jgi:hypothetical protein
MDRQFGEARYASTFVSNQADGCAGYDLMHIQDGNSTHIARILFWDACGQFFVETLGSDVPLTILEELIEEAKSTIKTG